MSDHRKLDHGPWLWMSKAAMDRARSAGSFTGVAVYAGLCRLESDAPAKVKDRFHASANNIADVSGVNARTVKRYLPLLAKAGLILVSSGKAAGENGAHEANSFRILDIGPCVTKSQACDFEITRDGTQERNLSRRDKEVSSEEKDNGSSAAAAPAGAGSGASKQKKTLSDKFQLQKPVKDMRI